jgi:hypothetical protein
LLHLIGRDLRDEARIELSRLLPLFYPGNAPEKNAAVVNALEIWWETDVFYPDFSLSAEWRKGSREYWKRVLEERHLFYFYGTMVLCNWLRLPLVLSSPSLISSFLFFGRFVVFFIC